MPTRPMTIKGVMTWDDTPQEPPTIWPSPGHPEHPIHYPPGIWGPNDPRPMPPIFIPPDSISDGVPTHPIVIPPTIWGPPGPWPTPPIYIIPPGSIGDGVPSHPIYLPPGIWGPPGPWPAPPIFLPPGSISDGVPTHPIYLPPLIWGGGNQPFPTPPIVIPDPVKGVSVVFVPKWNAYAWVMTEDLHPLSDPLPDPK